MTYEIRSLRSGFRRRAPAPLTPANRLNLGCQRALKMGPCVPEVLPRWLPAPSRLMRLRVAVRELESWLLADSERIAKFLGVAVAEIPADPDSVPDPKRLMVQLARSSRRRA